MKKYSLIIIFVLLFYLTPIKSSTANSLSVVINEITWMGTENSANDEWIELYNNTQNPINLDGWILKSADDKLKINLKGTIPAKGFYLLERTDDTTVPNITADLIYKGALSNDGEDLKLYDGSGNLIDETNCSSGWFAGDNSTKQTMERGVRPGSDPNSWQMSAEPGGTPKTENSIVIQTETQPQIKPDEPAVDDSRQQPQTVYPSGIVFNEILPSPEGPDAEEEWIEIFNQNNFEVELAFWQIKDKEGKTTTHTFPERIKITALGYLVLKRPETKITLNNEGDGLEFLNPKGELVDSINFGKALQNQSYNKTLSDWAWSNVLTPGAKNITSSPQSRQEPILTPRNIEKQEANITLSSKNSNYPVILIALIVAVFSTGTVLILKKYIDPVRD